MVCISCILLIILYVVNIIIGPEIQFFYILEIYLMKN